ncbi:hypothetical protein JAAARDRAFT_88094, partial [Jaapia argillacea MUCL 33604]
DQYVAKFEDLACHTKFDDLALWEYLKRGLSWDILKVLVHLTIPPTTFTEFKTAAIREDLHREQAWNEESCHQSTSLDMGVPMDVDAARFKQSETTGRFRKLTDTKRKSLREKGACFHCCKPGHFSNRCPLKKG